MDQDVPEHRHKPGDGSSGGRKPANRKARPDGRPFNSPRPDGQGGGRFEGPRPEGQRFDGPRSDGPRFDGPRREGSSGERPRFQAPRFQGPRPASRGDFDSRGSQGFEGPRQDAPRSDGPVPYRAPGGQRSFGPRPGGGAGRPESGAPRSGGSGYGAPRPGGFRGGPRPGGYRSDGPRSDGPRPGAPRPGGFRPGPGGFRAGPRPGGFRPDAPRPDAPRPDFDAGADRDSGPAQAPRREWQPSREWTPQPPRPARGGFGGPRQGFTPRPGFAPRPGFTPRPPAGDAGEGDGNEAPREYRPSRGPVGRPGGFGGPRPAGPRPGGFGGPRRSGPPGARPSFDNAGPRSGFRAGEDSEQPSRSGFGFGAGRPDDARPENVTPDGEYDETAGFDAAPDQPDDAEFAGESEFSGETEFADTPDLGADTDSDRDSMSEAGPAEVSPVPFSSSPRPRPARPPMRPDFRARSGGYQDRRPAGPAGAPAWTPRTPLGPPPADIIGEDEELIAGRHPVEEAFIAHRKAIRLLVVPQRRLALEKLVLHATNLRIPIVEVEGGTLTSWAGFDGHQGIALVTDKRKFAGLDDILARAIERKEAPFVLVLDSLEDPQNFGSLLRTAEATGVHGVIYPVRHQAPLSAAAVKASAGAVEHLLLVPVEDLAEALTDLHVRGLRVIGSDADAPLTARQADLRGPVVIVVGSEGQGLGPAVRRRCDTVVRIPMRGHIESLNAAVAGSILLYEASSQRGGEKPTVGPEPGTEPVSFAPEFVGDVPAPVAEAAVVAEAPPTAEVELSAAADVAAEPAPKAKPKRRATAKTAAGEAKPVADDDALLPGAPASAPPDTDPAE